MHRFDHAALLAWFRANRREMPWRSRPAPYPVWLSEIMLQQTQVATVRPYFDRFLRRFPTVRALARAEEDEVLKAWEGLGYYARARNLLRAAREVVARHGGRLPRDAAGLTALPGIGPYTAAAIASICFDERVPVVDGNVARVFARLWRLEDDFRQTASRVALAARLQPALDATESAGELNQAMMELGALVCRPRRPVCGACPLAAACQARRRGGQADYPRRTAAPRVPERQAVAVVVRRGPAWLMVRRPDGGLLGGLWELPGGARAANEPLPRAVRRGVREQTGLDVAVGPRTAAEATLRHAFSHFTLVLHGVRAERIGGRLKTGGGAAPRWVTPAAFRRLPVATAHRKLLARLGLG